MPATKKFDIQQKVLTMMKEKSGVATLWTHLEIAQEMGLTDRQADNALRNAWVTGKLYRHKDNDENNKARYALSIKEENRKIYVKGPPRDGSAVINKHLATTQKKKKKQLPSAKETRKLFADIANNLASLEDVVIAVLEEREAKEKQLIKLKSTLQEL